MSLRFDPENPAAGSDYHPGGPRLTGKRIALIFAAFVATFVTVDMYMWNMAASTFRGLVSSQAFNEGVKYDQQINAARAQDERGWQVVAHVDPLRDGVAKVTIHAADKAGKQLVGLTPKVKFSHPADVKGEIDVDLRETGLGVYSGEAHVAPGVYQLVIEFYEGDKQMFLSHNRLQIGG